MSRDTWRAMWATHGRPCGGHMANHVSDIWQAMCYNAWQRPMHVGHMECHVSTCITHLKAIYGAVRTSKEGQEGRGREKRKGRKEKRNGGKENRKGGKKRKGKKKREEK